ncbi:serine/threonine-protein phosphatase PGAM5, mitochondrial [Microplitis demolitor]|uniref:serine/threonine-protein phosphatase PGAM5, mitochondrial n=1 Tax=Microplitis demolitor TaxID=69319 RepID=UPI00044001F2|nr:serine/threonine-protein phosphatase PGAM5, mitochondrial [Microplitis demolitor]
MPSFSRFQKCAAILGVGTLSGAGILYYNIYSTDKFENPGVSKLKKNNRVTEYSPSVKWDSNWDHRDPKSLIKPRKLESITDDNEYNAEIEAHTPRTTRHLLLIRHGQYNLNGSTDAERTLTELGRNQAASTGKRLAQLALPYSLIVRSTMARAQETSKIIESSLPNVPVVDDSLLVEGCPILPEPPISRWRPDKNYFTDSPRIEAAFRKYFHRDRPKQESDSYTIIVGHSNVIRYFVCRALQFPPEAWLRLSLKHASITWVSIHPSGRVTLRGFGDAGHMLPEYLTSS